MGTVDVEQSLSQPAEEVGRRLLSLAEDQWLERKSARIASRDLANAMIGFANADGGTVVIGLHDGTVEGIDGDPRRVNAQRQANIDFCVPPVRAHPREIECVNSAGRADRLLVIEIESSEVVHANRKDEVFLRVGDSNRKLSFAQRQELLYDKGQASYEARPFPAADFQRLRPGLLMEYATAVGASDAMDLLRARGLATKDELTIAGCLLFASSPQEFFPEAFIRVIRYRGRERGSGATQQLTEDIRLEGPIPDQLLEARSHVSRLQPVRRALLSNGKFGDVPLVPEDAWLEGI